jgi:hypothetical protein
MNCPKCGYKQDDGPECLRCGLIFSKFHADPLPAPTAISEQTSSPSVFGYVRRLYRTFRWLSLAILIVALALIFCTSTPPAVVITPDAARVAAEKIRQFQSNTKHGVAHRLELDEPEINAWLTTNLALGKPGTQPSVPPQTAASLISLAKVATGGQRPDETSLEHARSSIQDVRIVLQDDQLLLYAVFDFHGKDLSLELEGRLSAQDGYLRLEPRRGKLGSLPLLAGTLRAVAARLFDSPENKEKFKLPSYIQDIRVENGNLVVISG